MAGSASTARRRLECIRGEKMHCGRGKNCMDADPGCEKQPVFGNMEGDFFDRRGITILEQDGTLKECVYDIMDAIKEKDAFLATGHISPEESLILCGKDGRSI